MKKTLAILLALMLVLVNVAALAADAKIVDPDNPVEQTTPSTPIKITKKYTVSTTDGTVLPGHVIRFEQQNKKIGNAKINGKEQISTTEITDTDVPDVTISDITFAENAPVPTSENMVINLPPYTHAAVYEYEFKEIDDGVAGVEYITDTIYLKVTIIETANPGEESSLKVGGVAVRRGSVSGEKVDEIENVYNANTLTVEKKVTGNMGDYQRDWNFTVTLTAPEGDTVRSTITTDKAVVEQTTAATEEGGEESATATGATSFAPGENGWAASRTFTFVLKHGESVTFKNLPVGVTYTVVETQANLDGYTTTYSDDGSGTISKDAASTSTVTNNKEIEIDTGVTVETLPYIMILAVAMIGALLVLRKREEY